MQAALPQCSPRVRSPTCLLLLSRMQTLGTRAMVTEGPTHLAGTFLLGVNLLRQGGGHAKLWAASRAVRASCMQAIKRMPRVSLDQKLHTIPPPLHTHASLSQNAASTSSQLLARSFTLWMLVMFFTAWASRKSPRLEP